MILFKKIFGIAIVVFAIAVLFCFHYYNGQNFLQFSDAAKFADISRSLNDGTGYKTNFIFFGDTGAQNDLPIIATWIPPLMPLAINVSFKLFGVSDFSIIATSSFFFILLVLGIYFFVRKLFGELTGILASIAVATSQPLLNYATTGASETLFIFEIVLGAYFFMLKKKWGDLLGIITIILLYFTRPQAFIYIAGLILFWLLLKFPVKKALSYFTVAVLAGILFDLFVLSPLSGKFFLYSILGTSQYVLEYVPGSSSSELLRGVSQNASLLSIFKKVFYNLYNFFKLMPQIMSPYLWALFVIGLFKSGKNKIEDSFKIATIFMVVITFLVAALSIPLYRYLHPVIPLVYLFAVATLVTIVTRISNFPALPAGRQFPISKQFQNFKLKISKKIFVNLISLILILFFVVGQTLGVIFLDSRFKEKAVNRDKPPVYVQLSWILRDNTNPEDVVVTNLDTWGSWYGERKTIWYPVKPDQLIGWEDKIDAIYLTSYLIDDENYYMGQEWRQIFGNPEKIEDEFVANNYLLKETFTISSDETYERQSARAVLLIKKPD